MNFSVFARKLSHWLGSPLAFMGAVAIVIVWVLAVVSLKFNEALMDIGNSVLSIVTFLMIFVLQSSQNVDTAAIHTKLDELVKADEKIEDEVAGIEDADC